jgi:hypothetical protein
MGCRLALSDFAGDNSLAGFDVLHGRNHGSLFKVQMSSNATPNRASTVDSTKRKFREALNQRGRIDFVQPDVGREKCVRGPDVPIVLSDHWHCRLDGL